MFKNMHDKLFVYAYKKFEAEGQYIFYRCAGCFKPVLLRDIKKKGCCPKCSGTRFKPTNLSFFENLYYLIRLVI